MAWHGRALEKSCAGMKFDCFLRFSMKNWVARMFSFVFLKNHAAWRGRAPENPEKKTPENVSNPGGGGGGDGSDTTKYPPF